MFLIFFSFLLFFHPTSSREYDDLTFLDDYFIKKEGDIMTFNRKKIGGMKSSALRGHNSKWSKAEIPVHFSSAYAVYEKLRIIEAMLEIHNKTCVRFRLATEDDYDFILIVKPRQSECSSMVGRQGGTQPLFLSSGCLTRKVILHELMHALGFIHEHNRADRDNYVSVQWQNINDDESHNFDKRKQNALSLMETGYAYNSIMHYEGTEFSDNGGRTLIPKNSKVRKMGGEDRLSPIDVLRINKYYSCSVYGDEIQLESDRTTERPKPIEKPEEKDDWRPRPTTTASTFRNRITTTEEVYVPTDPTSLVTTEKPEIEVPAESTRRPHLTTASSFRNRLTTTEESEVEPTRRPRFTTTQSTIEEATEESERPWWPRFTTTESTTENPEDESMRTWKAHLTTTEYTPRYQPISTLFPPIQYERRECQNPFDEPRKNGDCRWLVMRVVPDPNSVFHYLHCLPSLRTSDIRCGVWKRKACARGTIFDSELRSCRALHSIIEEDSEKSDEYY